MKPLLMVSFYLYIIITISQKIIKVLCTIPIIQFSIGTLNRNKIPIIQFNTEILNRNKIPNA